MRLNYRHSASLLLLFSNGSNCVNPNLTFLGFNLATKKASLEEVKGGQNKQAQSSPVQQKYLIHPGGGNSSSGVSPTMFPNFPNYFFIACSSIIHKLFIMFPICYTSFYKIFFGF
jgi:hypothetical protein